MHVQTRMKGIAVNRSQSLFVLIYICSNCLLSGCQPEDRATEPVSPQQTSVLSNRNSTQQKRGSSNDSVRHSQTRPVFVDVAKTTQLQFEFHSDYVPERLFLPEVMGGGVGCIDFDRDGDIDFFFPNGTILEPTDSGSAEVQHDVLFQSRRSGADFREVSKIASVAGLSYGQGCAVGDLNVDGFEDLYVTNYGKNALYLNNGDGTFTESEDKAVQGQQLWSTSPAWVDLNDDGLVDLYVANYLNVTSENTHPCDYEGIIGYCGPGQYQALPDEVFINQGNGEFVESAAQLGFVAENGKGLAISVLDFDNDLKPEVYVANDMTPNNLYSRTRIGDDAETTPADSKMYSDVAMLSGCAVSESGLHEASMGVACADFDNDLLTDMYLTHFFRQKNTLYHNRGNLTFSDDSRRFQVTKTSNDYLGFGVAPLDFDTNGFVDLFVANGHVLGPNYSPSEMLPQLLENIGGTHFEDLSRHAGEYFQIPKLGRGAACVDFDNDLDADITISHIFQSASLLRNDTDRHGEAIGLILTDRNRNFPVGGRVEFQSGKDHRVWPIVSGGSYLSSPDPRMIVTIPESVAIQGSVIRIFWPSGTVTEYQNLTPGRYWLVREDQRPLVMPRSTMGNVAL